MPLRFEREPMVSLVIVGILFVMPLAVNGQTNTSNSAAESSPIQLSQPSKRVLFDKSAFQGPSTPIPHWDNGFLITREAETFQSGLPNVRIYDHKGAKVREAALWFPGSTRVTVSAASVISDGRIVAAGGAYKPDGTAARYIALTDLNGKIRNVIQTGDFSARSICAAPDGSIWSFGDTAWDDSLDRPKPGGTLRQFDFQKGQVGAYIPRSSFPDHQLFASATHIRCSSSEVVVYSAVANVFIEHRIGTDTPRVYRASVPDGLWVLGIAVPKHREIYGYLAAVKDTVDSGANGLYSLVFDESTITVRWVPVEGTLGASTQSGTVAFLWGADGEQLIVSRGGDPAGPDALHWASPLKR